MTARGGAAFRDCIRRCRDLARTQTSAGPGFRGASARSGVLSNARPTLNHNLETVRVLYKQARPRSDYAHR